MCDSRRPENGADSAPLDQRPEPAKPHARAFAFRVRETLDPEYEALGDPSPFKDDIDVAVWLENALGTDTIYRYEVTPTTSKSAILRYLDRVIRENYMRNVNGTDYQRGVLEGLEIAVAQIMAAQED